MIPVACFLSNFVQGHHVPDTLSSPVIVKVVGREVTLAWTKPDNDGGAKVSGYRIACAVPNSNLAKYVTGKSTTTARVVKNLRMGQTYVFAVSAKNSVGYGKFSKLSEHIKVPDFAGK